MDLPGAHVLLSGDFLATMASRRAGKEAASGDAPVRRVRARSSRAEPVRAAGAADEEPEVEGEADTGTGYVEIFVSGLGLPCRGRRSLEGV